MGNSSSKDTQNAARGQSHRHLNGSAQSASSSAGVQQAAAEHIITQIYGPTNGGSRRGSRHDLSFLHIGRDRNAEQQANERPRETRQEKEARRTERERQARLKERELSIREESVDGGYLVTLGTYTGPEDFSKPVVRQLQIERRLAPFWKGLNDHSDSWTEHQLVAAVRGLPIPAADEIPPELARSPSQNFSGTQTLHGNSSSLAVPVPTRSVSDHSDSTATLSSSHPATTSNPGPSTPLGSSPLFRGRAKTLASLATGSKGPSPDLTPQEIRLPSDSNVNGLPMEAYLYREPMECPICFMYYPPYLNKTRCCDQPICSECFVQIKRPDPHPPEHEQPGQPRPTMEEAETLVSEVAACPFCVTPEFGVTFDPPPFRRGLAYANQPTANPFKMATSATSSQTSLQSHERRRTISISATAPQVITTDRVRPDWAKKLADARAHALRRSAAATALHNAAYVLGNPDGSLRPSYGRRRRSLFMDGPSIGPHSLRDNSQGSSDLFPGRTSSRRHNVDDLEDLMMMEAIRLSLAAEEDRKRKEENESKKEEKKKVKEAKKEAKQAEKLAKKAGSSSSLHKMHSNDSGSTWASSSMARSTSNLGAPPSVPDDGVQGKGKAPAQDFAGFVPISEPTSTLNTEMRETISARLDPTPPLTTNVSSAIENPQRHLEESRANLQPAASTPIPMPTTRHHLRQLSAASSAASSIVDSPAGSFGAEPASVGGGLDVARGARENSPFRSATPPESGVGSLEPMLNFRSLAAMVGTEDKARETEHLEDVPAWDPVLKAEEELREPSTTASPAGGLEVDRASRSRGDSGESSSSAPPPIYVERVADHTTRPPGPHEDGDEITPAPPPAGMMHGVDNKFEADMEVLDHGHGHEATQ